MLNEESDRVKEVVDLLRVATASMQEFQQQGGEELVEQLAHAISPLCNSFLDIVLDDPKIRQLRREEASVKIAIAYIQAAGEQVSSLSSDSVQWFALSLARKLIP